MFQLTTTSLKGSVGLCATSAMRLNKGKAVGWLSGRGFGFIEEDVTATKHFVHNTSLKKEEGGYRALTVGQEVEFDVSANGDRTSAVNVTAVGGALLPSGPRPAEGSFQPNRGRGGFGGNRGGRGGRGGQPQRDYE
jgi:cold shock CspA family protein